MRCGTGPGVFFAANGTGHARERRNREKGRHACFSCCLTVRFGSRVRASEAGTHEKACRRPAGDRPLHRHTCSSKAAPPAKRKRRVRGACPDLSGHHSPPPESRLSGGWGHASGGGRGSAPVPRYLFVRCCSSTTRRRRRGGRRGRVRPFPFLRWRPF